MVSVSDKAITTNSNNNASCVRFNLLATQFCIRWKKNKLLSPKNKKVGLTTVTHIISSTTGVANLQIRVLCTQYLYYDFARRRGSKIMQAYCFVNVLEISDVIQYGNSRPYSLFTPHCYEQSIDNKQYTDKTFQDTFQLLRNHLIVTGQLLRLNTAELHSL